MLIRIKVFTGAKKEKIVKKSDENFHIYVKEPAQRNEANKKALELVRKYFKVYNKIMIISGHHSQNKIIGLEK